MTPLATAPDVARLVERRWRELAAAILILCLGLRLAALGQLPVFIDEAIHFHQADQAWSRGAWLTPGIARFLPTWINALVVPHVDDPLLALRGLSAFWGALSTLGLVVLGRSHGDVGAGLLAALLYAVAPYAVVHERMGLIDPLFAALTTWSVVAASAWRARPALPRAVAFGLLLAGPILCKPYGVLGLALPWIFRPPAGTASKAAPLVVWLVTVAASAPLWLDLATLSFLQRTFAESQAGGNWIEDATTRLSGVVKWHVGYLTPVGAVIAAVAVTRLVIGYRSARTPVPVALAWVLWGPLLAVLLALQTRFAYYPRHLLASIPLLLFIVAAEARPLFDRRLGRVVAAGVGTLLLVWCLRVDRSFATDPRTAAFVDEDGWQYVTGWPSGYGLAEVVEWLRAERRTAPVLVLSNADHVPLSLGLDLMLRGTDIARVEISGDAEQWAARVPQAAAFAGCVYFAREVDVEQEGPPRPVLDLAGSRVVGPAFRVGKPEGMAVIELFRVDAAAVAPGLTTEEREGVLELARRLPPSDVTRRYDLGVGLAAERGANVTR